MASGTRYAPPRSLRKGSDLEALRVALQTNERYMRRWANRLGQWKEWEPAWTADTTNPTIGDGVITGRYVEYGDLVIATFVIQPGATTTFGSGEYLISKPLPARPHEDEIQVGGLTLSGSSRFHWALVETSVGIRASAYNAEAQWTPTNPFTMANGDAYLGQFMYEAL